MLTMLWAAILVPAALGLLSATIGYFIFRRGDLP